MTDSTFMPKNQINPTKTKASNKMALVKSLK